MSRLTSRFRFFSRLGLCLRPRLSWVANLALRRSVRRLGAPAVLVACLPVLLAVACTKKPADGKAASAAAEAAQAAVAPPEAATATAAGAGKAEDQGRLALGRAYPALRCALTGAAVADDGLWQQHGFASPSAFAAAWSKAAAADPAWARSVVSTALRTPCANRPAVAPPEAATPAAAPAAVAP